MGQYVVFFDLGRTLGDPVFSLPSGHLVGFEVYPFVPSLLRQLQEAGHRLGVISNTGAETGDRVDAVLEKAGILGFFEAPLRLYSADVGLDKSTPAIFAAAVERAELAGKAAACLFVGEDEHERKQAEAAGLRTCPDPRSVPEIVAQGPAAAASRAPR